MNKLPEEVRLFLSRRIPEKDWSMLAVMKVLQEEIQARERVAVDKTAPGRVERQGPHTGATLLSGVGHGSTTCCYCQKPHLSKDCRIVTQPGARKQILLKAGRCFVCLRTGHVSRDCRSKSKCTKCSRRHHVSICQGDGGGSSSHGQ